MKNSFKVALLLEDKSSTSLLKSIFTLTEKRIPSYVKEEDISEFGYLGLDICIVDPNSLTSLKTYLKILKYHNKVKALFLLGPNLPATTVRDKLRALEYQEKYANLLKIFSKEISAIPVVAYPFSWIKVVQALDNIAKSVNAASNNTAQTLGESALDANGNSDSDSIHYDNPYEDPAAFRRHSVDYASLGYPTNISSVSGSQLTNRGGDNSSSTPQPPSVSNSKLSIRQQVELQYSSRGAPGSFVPGEMSQELDIRAIVIDESSASRRWLAEKLATRADKIDFAIDGQEAMIMMNQKTYDVVFLDTDTVSYDGYQVCKIIKNDLLRQGLQCQVVLMTSQGGMFDKFRIKRSNCDAVLTKPISDSELFKIVNYVRKIRLG